MGLISALGAIFGGVYVSCLVILAVRKGLRSVHWPTTTGQVTSSSIQKHRAYRAGVYYTPLIQYRYQVDGAKYRSHTITSSLKVYLGKSDAAEYTERYLKGSQVTVYYNPNNPSKAALETGVSIPSLLLASGFGGLLLAGGLSILAALLH